MFIVSIINYTDHTFTNVGKYALCRTAKTCATKAVQQRLKGKMARIVVSNGTESFFKIWDTTIFITKWYK